MEPPPCIQNAMMTKDKKPFTYTPGGLNLNEIRSPRMARRIERNAAYEGVGSTPAQQNRPQVAPGTLPPSALAAMQPQMHVQVFPSGPPPPPPMNYSRGGAPPPPPPMSNIPPPPPPPTQPLPTQKVRTSDHQVVERPDMTKIIPENPMGLLKKTGGPRVKNTLLEEMYKNPERSAPQQMPMNRHVTQQTPMSSQPQQVRSPPIENVSYQPHMVQKSVPEPPQQAWSPPIIERKESARNTNQPPVFPQQPERNVNVGSIYIPPINAQQNKNMPTPPPNTPSTPILKEAPKPWQQKQQVKQDEAPQWVKKEPSFSPTPAPQEQHTPQSATSHQQQRPRWPQGNPTHPVVQEQRYQEPRVQQHQQRQQAPPEDQGVYTQRVLQPQFDPSNHPNAVFVTQPIVLQHPGQNYGPPVINRRENIPAKQDGGVRTIPIHIEGMESPNRNLNRQQSWSSNPTQSGSFRVIQKITGTDGEERGENARYPQQFPAEQMRKMQLNDTDQELLNRFKQGKYHVLTHPNTRNTLQAAENAQNQIERNVMTKPNLVLEMYFDEENPRYRGGHIPSRVFRILDESDVDSEKYLHGESIEPRYKGATIPSKAFRILQNMTDEPNKNLKNVPNEDYQSKPQVRTIPIQIEGSNGPKNYVPPSQQVPAEEPKKYTGSSIPSRSFRMLQAMTAPDSCANVKEANETNDNYDFPYQGNNWGFPPAYPMYNPQPYWPPYYSPVPYKIPHTEHSNSDPELNRASATKTPQPYFGYPYTPTRELDQKSVSRTPSSFSRCSSSTELENINWRQTPVPFPMFPSPTTPVPGRKTPKRNQSDSESDSKTPYWYGYPPPDGQEHENTKPEGNYNYYPPYPPPFYDPYYFPYYYYGYPPMFSPLPIMRPSSDPEDLNGYSSMDEMSYYNQRNKQPSTNPTNQNVPNSSPEIIVTPTPEHDNENQKDNSSSDSDTETETNDVEPVPNSGKLQTIRSVTDINVYKQSDEESELTDADEESEASSNSSVYEEEREEEVVPHQLSVIFEVSEVTDTPRNARESSVFSDCTTVEGLRSDDEDCEDGSSKRWISDNLMEIASRIQSRINSRIELDDTEVYTSFTMKSPSPRRETVLAKDESTVQEKENNNQKTSVANEPSKENEQESHSKEEIHKSSYQDNDPNMDESKYEATCIQLEETKNDLKPIENNSTVCVATDETPSKESSDSEDWWGVIGKNEDDFPRRKSSTYCRDTEIEENVVEETLNPNDTKNEGKIFTSKEDEGVLYEKEEQNSMLEEYNVVPNQNEELKYKENDADVNTTSKDIQSTTEKSTEEMNTVTKLTNNEDDVFFEEKIIPKLEITSAHSSHSSGSPRKISSDSDESSESEDSDSSEEEENKHDLNNNEENEEETIVIPSIKDRIKALQECITVKKRSTKIEEEIRINVKSQVESIDSVEQVRSKPISAKSSVKSFDEISEEDSGVTDLSKQYSDNEEFPELRKMSKYQRASTHSRLFQLLQEECENEEDEDLESRKTHLSLPLNSEANDKLAEELVHSMLKQKKGQIFRNMSVDKLHAAAKKVLQEDVDSCDTPSEGYSDLLSPLRNDTGNSTPQEFYGYYNEYVQYYDSWAHAAAMQENEIIQSKTFKMIQEAGSKTNGFATTLAKCPRVLSGKNVHSDLKKLVENPEEAPSIENPDPKS